MAKTSVATAVANLALTAGLAPVFGIWGVLAGTVVALTCGALAQVIYVHRRYGLPRDSYLDAVGPALGHYGLYALPVAAVSYSSVIHGRLASILVLLALAVGYLLACLGWAWRSGRLPSAVVAWLGVAPSRGHRLALHIARRR